MSERGAPPSRYASAALTVVLTLTGGAPGPDARVTPASAPAVDAGPPVPVRLDIPAIGVHTGLARLGLLPDGTMAVPAPGGGAPAGWYEHSPAPGEPGTAVLAGHVNPGRDGPAVFHRLGELRRGDPIAVRRADGSRIVFEVTAVRLGPTSRFPAGQVAGPAGRAELVLITCGGDFDRTRRKHRSDLLVVARPAPGRA